MTYQVRGGRYWTHAILALLSPADKRSGSESMATLTDLPNGEIDAQAIRYA
jgi:hypothetical protein